MESPPSHCTVDNPPLIEDYHELLRHGVVQIPIRSYFTPEECQYWSHELSQVTPEIVMAEGDNEYAFYRNILNYNDQEEYDTNKNRRQFPFERFFQICDGVDDHASFTYCLENFFGIRNAKEDLRLDDAFCLHYNMTQADSSGAKHVDPSDITVNICLDKTDDCVGSEVVFYGKHSLAPTTPGSEDLDTDPVDSSGSIFRVAQKAGYATIHYGSHPHETTALLQGGHRTNIILTYCYATDEVAKRCLNRHGALSSLSLP
jgi:hypothetical protein